MSTERMIALKAQRSQYIQRGQMFLDAREKRELTADDIQQHNELLAKIEGLDKQIEKLESDAALIGKVREFEGGRGSFASNGDSWGQQFLAGVGDFFRTGGHRRAGVWNSPAVELKATTLSEGAGSGAGLVIPDTQPGIVPLPTRALVVADLLAPGNTTSASVSYMAETAWTNAAAPTAEGSPKPESALVFAAVTEPVRKLATWLPVTEEILEDVLQLRSYIDQRLRTGVQLAEDDQLLNGNGTAPNLLGLLNRPGLAPDVARGTDTNPDAIAKQIAALATNSNLAPDGIVMHPTNYLAVQLGKNTAGDYYGDGPFAAAGRPSLWGLPVALTVGIPLGTALVGAFKLAAQIFRHGGINVAASNSHQDFFVKNLVAIRAEERLALAVYRASGIGKVTGLN
jgi:HK97 family phage major capsid protein